MYLVVIAWLYVTLMMALAEAFSPAGSLLGAVLTFGLYGLLPMAIVVYILGTPARKRRLREARNAAELAWQAAQKEKAAQAMPAASAAPASADPDAGSHAPAAAQAGRVAAVREKP